jgi:hypothetical protein
MHGASLAESGIRPLHPRSATFAAAEAGAASSFGSSP